MGTSFHASPAQLHLQDHHVHTRLCNHGIGEMHEYVEAAYRKGLRRIVFLEHMEEAVTWKKRTWLLEEDFDRYFSEGVKLQLKYQGKIEIGLGVECGYNSKARAVLNKRLGNRSWSEIGISCHFLELPNQTQHLNLFSRDPEVIKQAEAIGVDTLLSLYFETLIEAVQALNGTLLCHLDGALRHLEGLELRSEHYRQVDTLLQHVADKGMKLEVNSSGLRIRGEQFPCAKILSMAKRYNIPLQYGSDAHKPADVGYDFNLLARTIK